jgi:4-diphosphocytidyl-2-C-methyl-D-erythritol kinase
VTRRVVASCPAKINLGLAVLGRRADGFHEIATLFQAIDLEDRIEVEDAPELSLTCDDPAVPADGTNLVLRAARALQAHFPAAQGRGAAITLRKSIPAGGGLGGGSSNAAGTLLALTSLWNLSGDARILHEIAAGLGSDVSFFLHGGRALGSGRGECLTLLPAGPERALVLGTPAFPLSTAEVYAALALPLTPQHPAVTVTRFLVKLAEGNDFARASNDLERAALAMRPELAAFKGALLARGAEVALLCGSGSSVFGMFSGRTEAGEAATRLRDAFPGWTVRVALTSALGARITA